MNFGPNVAAVRVNEGREGVFIWGIETSLARLGESDGWQGGFIDWSEANGFGGGFELGYFLFGLDVALTQRAGVRPRVILTLPIHPEVVPLPIIVSVYAGRDKNGKQFGALFKWPVLSL